MLKSYIELTFGKSEKEAIKREAKRTGNSMAEFCRKRILYGLVIDDPAIPEGLKQEVAHAKTDPNNGGQPEISKLADHAGALSERLDGGDRPRPVCNVEGLERRAADQVPETSSGELGSGLSQVEKSEETNPPSFVEDVKAGLAAQGVFCDRCKEPGHSTADCVGHYEGGVWVKDPE